MGHGIGMVCGCGQLDKRESARPLQIGQVLLRRAVGAHDNRHGHGLIEAAPPPQPVIVVGTERGGKSISAAEEIDGARLSIVAHIDHARGLLCRRQLPVNRRDLPDHLLPAEHVGIILRQIRQR